MDAARSSRLDNQQEAKRALYCEYLEKAEVAWYLCQTKDPVSPGEIDAWWVDYQHVRRRLKIEASNEVVERMLELNRSVARLFEDLFSAISEAGDDEESSFKKRLAVWGKHQPSVPPALRRLEAAMRSDVAI